VRKTTRAATHLYPAIERQLNGVGHILPGPDNIGDRLAWNAKQNATTVVHP